MIESKYGVRMKMLGRSIVGLLVVIGSMFTMTAAQGQVDGRATEEVTANAEGPRQQKAARAPVCSFRYVSFKKVDGDATDWWAGKARVYCNRIALRIDVQPVIHRQGGGAESRTYYKRPAKSCHESSWCTATFKVRDIGGRQSWSFGPGWDGTRVFWGVGTDVVGYNCHERDKFYCPKPWEKFG